MRDLAYLAFTDRGAKLARDLCAALGGTVTDAREEEAFSLRAWTAERFDRCEALVFVGAAGIAVRAVAPFLVSKASDPAVVSLDEWGSFVVPLVSGHLGGANDLARRIAALCGGTAVVSTATDVNGVFAVDSWARRQGLRLLQPERIKAVSSRLLSGESVGLYSAFPIRGTPPEGVRLCPAEDADVLVDIGKSGSGALTLLPPCLTLGIGCRRGITEEELEAACTAFLDESGVRPEAIGAAASIDRKADEEGLLHFCKTHGWEPRFFTAAELRDAEGPFQGSAFVERTVGVDNVCERSAVLFSGGRLFRPKWVRDGVTLALACRKPELDWSWTDG